MKSFRHLLPVSAVKSEAGKLSIGGHELDRLAEEYGTPLYVYDAATLRQQVWRLKHLLDNNYPTEAEISYAAKAYFSLRFARHLQELGVGVDVVSMGELAVAHKAGFLTHSIHLHGNNKSPDELCAGLDGRTGLVVVDSLDELAVLEALAAERQQAVRIWLRISPGIGVDTHASVQTAHAATKFGLPIRDGQAAEAVRRAKASNVLKLVGLHTHLGSNLFDVQPYRQAVAALAALGDETEYVPQEISPGGGWGVPYLPEQAENPAEPWIETISAVLQAEFSRRGWLLPKVVVEPGRWLVARAGMALYRVGMTKRSGDGTHFITVDGGMADNPRPALYGSPYTALLPNRMDEDPSFPVCIAGKYCESGDVMIPEVWLPEVRRGDLLAMPSAGAYQLSMASNYNLAERPAVLWLDEGEVEVLQRRERLDAGSWWLGD